MPCQCTNLCSSLDVENEKQPRHSQNDVPSVYNLQIQRLTKSDQSKDKTHPVRCCFPVCNGRHPSCSCTAFLAGLVLSLACPVGILGLVHLCLAPAPATHITEHYIEHTTHGALLCTISFDSSRRNTHPSVSLLVLAFLFTAICFVHYGWNRT